MSDEELERFTAAISKVAQDHGLCVQVLLSNDGVAGFTIAPEEVFTGAMQVEQEEEIWRFKRLQ